MNFARRTFVKGAGAAGTVAVAVAAGLLKPTEVLAAEWAPQRVRVNAVAPAVFLTELAKASIEDGSASFEAYVDRSPTGRLGELPELAQTVLFLASDASSYTTGHCLTVDGGMTSS